MEWHKDISDYQIMERAAEIMEAAYFYNPVNPKFCSSSAVKDYLFLRLKNKETEVFSVLYLRNDHTLIEYQEMFNGTVDACSVYPREVFKQALKLNACAVILGHNHPSGSTEASGADKKITKCIKQGLELIDVKVLDHIIVGNKPYSMAEGGVDI